MAPIREKIDFTVAIFVVHDAKILLIHHRKLDKWLPRGGHIDFEKAPGASRGFFKNSGRFCHQRFSRPQIVAEA